MRNDLVNSILKELGLPPLSDVPPARTIARAPIITHSDVTIATAKKLSNYPNSFVVKLHRKEHKVTFWAGEKLSSQLLACDTETKMITGPEVPTLALVSFSSGEETVIVRPEDAASFLMLHADCELVFHNAAFDFWVLINHFNKMDHDDAFEHLWTMAENNRLHDTMILDQLVRLGLKGEFPNNRNLGEVALEYANVVVNKDDPYRLRYGELIGKDWARVEEGFFLYAAIDPLATILSYGPLQAMAQSLAAGVASQSWPDAISRFGLLSEGTQIRAAIALASITQNGAAVLVQRNLDTDRFK